MCTIIHADYLLATVLSDNEGVSFDRLNELRRAIENRCADVVVDVSSPALHSALHYYPEIFERREGRIARAANAQHYLCSEYRDHVFTSSVPPNVHERVCNVISEWSPS